MGGGVCPRMNHGDEVSAQGCVCLPGGMSAQGSVSQHVLRQNPPPVDRMTDRCKNITLPQLRLETKDSLRANVVVGISDCF